MPRMVLLPLNSCAVTEGPDSRCGLWRRWASMALRVLFFITLLLLADAQKWPVSGDCWPCECGYKLTSFGRMRTVNCSRRGMSAIPASLPDDLMALDLSWNLLDVEQLRQHLCEFQSLQSVSLSFADLTTLSDILKECSSLLELNLTGNRLAQVDSKTFVGLKNLRRLLGLEVESVVGRDVFKYLTNLKDLDVIFHGETLPKGLFDDLVIQSLNLVVTRTTSLPNRVFEFGQKTLNTLQLIGERVTQVHEDLLDGLYVLKKLYLVMPHVQKLPERFFHSQQIKPGDKMPMVRLANLQEVEISGIHTLPAMLFNQLVTLETLQLKEIGSFPQMGFLAGVINLRSLLITGSKLTNIPAGWFKELYSLKTLTLSGIQLERLHKNAFKGLINLSYLDLSYNSLDQVTEKMLMPLNKTLETLILRGNFLAEINQDCLGKLSSLRHLDLSGNRLANVYSNSFMGMTYLSVLDLSNNRLTSLPKDLFRDLLQLESLFLSDNYLVEFPKAVLLLNRSLMSLDLASNEIRKVPASQLCQFVYLERINILDNYLHCDCPLLAFSQCQKISVEGQCKSPLQYVDLFIRDIEVPTSCVGKNQSKERLSDPQTKPYISSIPYQADTPQTKPYEPNMPQSAVDVGSSSHQLLQTGQSDTKTLSKGMPTVLGEQPMKVQQSSVLNQTLLLSSVAETDSAESAVQLIPNVTIIRKLYIEKLTNQSRKENSAPFNNRKTTEERSFESATTQHSINVSAIEQNSLSETTTMLDKAYLPNQNASTVSVIQTESSQEPSDSISLQKEKHVLQSGGARSKQSIAGKQEVTQQSSITSEHSGTDEKNVKPHKEQANAHSLTNKTETEKKKNAILNIQRSDHADTQKEDLSTSQQLQSNKTVLRVQSSKKNSQGKQEMNETITQSTQQLNKEDLREIQKSYKENFLKSNKDKSTKPASNWQFTRDNINNTQHTNKENTDSSQQSNKDDARSIQHSNIKSTTNTGTHMVAQLNRDENTSSAYNQHEKTSNKKTPMGTRTSVNQAQSHQLSTAGATEFFSDQDNTKPSRTVKNQSSSSGEVTLDTEQKKNATEEVGSLDTNNVSVKTSDRMMGDSPVQGSGIPLETIKSQPLDGSGNSSLGSSTPKPPKPLLRGQGEGNSTTLSTDKAAVSNPSRKTTRGGKKPFDTKQADSIIISENISAIPSTELPRAEESVDSKSYNATSTVISIISTTNAVLVREKLPPFLGGGVDSVELVNETYKRPEGEDPINNKKNNGNAEKTTFNFIISAMVALSVFGFTVLGIFCVRRWQQKGSYIVSNEDTEMNIMDTDISEAAIVFPKPKSP